MIAILVLVTCALLASRRRRRSRRPAHAVIVSPRKSTVIAQDGGVRSVQSVQLTLAEPDLARLCNAASLENLGRTYWRFLSRMTVGLIRVVYGHNERSVVLLGRPLTLLRFEAPEYILEPGHGSICWRIRDGLLVARGGRGRGYLAIDVRRSDTDAASPFRLEDRATLQIEVEVANFYPALAVGFSTPFYEATQSSIHVLVTHAFLRSLAKLDLAKSRVGRFALHRP
ncbi:MAG: hypothetical protein ACR2OB_13495 [Solirubrobacteraceae bacterium]